jgi:two-component sensor histidine kinase
LRGRVADQSPPQPPRRPSEDEQKAQLRGRVADQSQPQAPRRPSEASAKPATSGETKAKTQFSQTLTHDAETLLRKIHGAARDIVQVIDSELPRDLERRFTSGEGDVYTHHLLENRVARLPHILERRYKSEREVRSRVDTYIRLFERMLDTYAEAPRGDQLVDASLASESGKLYLLLAQASGRISPQ